MGADDENFGYALRRIAHLLEEFVLAANFAAVLARAAGMFLELLREDLHSIELKSFRGVGSIQTTA